MKKTIYLALLILIIAPLSKVHAGPAYPLCVAKCLSVCTITTTTLLLTPLAPVAHHTGGKCVASCLKHCLWACFGAETRISVLEQGRKTEKNISEIVEGDLVLTIKDGNSAWTKVVTILKNQGEFDFIQVFAEDLQNGTQKQLTVTPEHGLILSNSHGGLTLDSAGHLEIEDKIIAADGKTLQVVGIKKVAMGEKYILETESGTVLASDIFVSTICSEEVAGGERLFEQTMDEWQKQHIQLTAETP